MENNIVKSVAIANAGKKSERFNFSHDLATTASFGELQPAFCQFMLPDSKGTFDIESLTRFSPLVAPAFTRMKQKIWSMFVPLDEIYPNYDFMMSQKAVSREGGRFVPQNLPKISVKQLSSLCLLGASATVYRGAAQTGENQNKWEATKDINAANTYLSDGRLSFMFSSDRERLSNFDFTGPSLDLSLLWSARWSEDTVSSNVSVKVPFGRVALQAFSSSLGIVDGELVYDIIPMDKADAVLVSSVYEGAVGAINGHRWAVAFRFSAFGQRMAKLLTGLGYPISLSDTTEVSLLPLLAWYRGYFELFGITRFKNFEQSACFRLIQVITQLNKTNFTDHGQPASLFDDTSSVLWDFFREVSDCYVTDAPNYVSIHQSSVVNGPEALSTPLEAGSLSSFGLGFIDVNSTVPSDTFGVGDVSEARHVRLQTLQHGALDENFLKICYRWVNRQSVLGQNIAEALRANGYGKYIDEVKVDFIGYDETRLDISDVTSTSDTFNADAGTGASLGDYAGKSVNYDKSKGHTFDTQKAGYWITYLAIVPESGFCQSYDHTVKALTRFDIYTPDFDALGYEATQMGEIVGSGNVFGVRSYLGSYDHTRTYGFVPRYTGWKVKPNKINGGFALPSQQANFLPYTLDKILPINRLSNMKSTESSSAYVQYVKPIMTYSDTPTAGDIWRYNFKYGWMGNLNRIFVQDADLQRIYKSEYSYGVDYGLDGNTLYEYAHYDVDNMLIHGIINFQYDAPMKPIGHSFETYDETASPNASVQKA